MEGDEEFSFVLSGVSGGIIGSPSAATVTIIDDDVSYLRFASAFVSVDEDAAQVQLTVTRSGGSDFPVLVEYSTVDDTAVGGLDFTSVSNVTLEAGPPATLAPKSIVIPIADDDLTEGFESFAVELSNPGPAAILGSPSSATVTIADDDIANLSLSSMSYMVNDGTASRLSPVNRTLSSVGAVSVDYQTSNGTAVAGQDYNTMVGTLDWGDGDTQPKSFSITITDDQDVEITETVNITLSNPTGPAALTAPDAAVLSISDNDASQIRYSNAEFSEVEDQGVAEITVMRVIGDTGVVSVDYNTAMGSATPGEDYEERSETLSWGDGESENKIVTITLLDDSLVEGNETVLLSLSNATGNVSMGDPSGAT